MTIAQIVHDNEVCLSSLLPSKVQIQSLFKQKSFGYTDDDIYNKVSYLNEKSLLSLKFDRSCEYGE